MSAFSTVVGRLGELSESELKQLYLIVGVRLGCQDTALTGKASRPTPNKGGNAKSGKARRGGDAKKAASKGNPQRKSQWETHPLYREYKRLKQVVEAQAKEKSISFAAVDSPEREAYNSALSQWLEAKSSFRDHRGPEKEAAEKVSAKGKEKATAPVAPRPGKSGPVANPDLVGDFASSAMRGAPASWADQVQDAMDTDGSDQGSDSSSEDEEPVKGSNSKVHTRTASLASLPSRGTPPKKPSRGSLRN